MASDLISREASVEYLRRDFGYHFPLYDGSRLGTTQLLVTREDVISAILHNIPAVDAVEVVRCKDCVYWRDRHVLTPDGQRKSYAEMPPEAFNDDSGLGVGAVTCAYGINCGSRCEIDCDSGYGVDKSVFREAGDFCSRGVKKDAVD